MTILDLVQHMRRTAARPASPPPPAPPEDHMHFIVRGNETGPVGELHIAHAGARITFYLTPQKLDELAILAGQAAAAARAALHQGEGSNIIAFPGPGA